MTPSGQSPAADRAQLVAVLLRVADQDLTAFRLLYRLTSAKLFGICLRICGERRAAEDVLQDVYLSVWQRASTFRPERASAMTWLGTVAHNRAIDWRRAQHAPPTQTVDAANDVTDQQPNAETMLLLEEHETRLLECLEALDATQRDVIRQAFFGGLTYAELAMQRRVPLGTVKSWVRRGLLRLRDCLDDA